MKRTGTTFARRFVRLRELERSPFCALLVAFDDDTGREVTLRQILIPGLAQKGHLAQRLRECVARAQQVSHACLMTPVASGIDRLTDSVWVAYDGVVRPDETPTGMFASLGFAERIALLAEVADALVVAGATSSVHGTLHPRALRVEPGAPRGVLLIDLDLGQFLREGAMASGTKEPPYTPYAAPEILRSPQAAGTKAADVHALAAMVSEAVEDARHEASPELAALLGAALGSSPEARPSMRDVAAALHVLAETLVVRGGRSERALRDSRRDSTLVVEGAEMEAARRVVRPAQPPPGRRRRPEGLVIGLCALVLAGVVAFVTRRENVDQGGKLRLRTQSTEADGGAPAMVRLFVDDRFRGVVQPEEHKDVSLPLGGHRVELRFDDGGVAARASIDVRGLTNVTMRVPPVRSDDIPAILRRARDSRFGERCAGSYTGTLSPGRRDVSIVLSDSIEGGVCGSVDAGLLGEGTLEGCDFDGERTLIGEVKLRGPRPLAVRITCGSAPTVTFFAPTGEAALVRDNAAAPEPEITDAGTP